MLSRLKRILPNFVHPRLKYMPISLKLALIYSIMLSMILVITLSATLIGIHYVLYREAEISITLSADYAEKKANEKDMQSFIHDVEKSSLIPGVVIRITDSGNNIIYDSVPRYISIEKVQHSLELQQQNRRVGDYIRNVLLPDNLKFIDFKHFWIFYTQRTVEKDDNVYTLHFLRTITAEKAFLTELGETIFYAGLVGVLISIICGFLLSRKLLKPLSDITRKVKEIEIQDLNQRIKVQPTHDELLIHSI